MAHVKHSDGRDEIVKAEEATEIWLILSSELEPTPEQERAVQSVSRVFLNWRNPLTPDSYIEKYKGTIFPLIIRQFMIEPASLRPTKPDSGDKVMIDFCDKWGITAYGKITQMGVRYS